MEGPAKFDTEVALFLTAWSNYPLAYHPICCLVGFLLSLGFPSSEAGCKAKGDFFYD